MRLYHRISNIIASPYRHISYTPAPKGEMHINTSAHKQHPCP